MGLQKTINSSLTTAFKQLKDLAVDAEFHRKAAATFEFNTGEFPTETESVKVIKVLEIKPKKDATNHNASSKTLLFQTSLIDLSAFDTVKIKNLQWRVGPVINNGFVSTVDVFKEG